MIRKYKVGPGVLKVNASRTVTISTTDEDATITAATPTFSAADVGASITGAGIPVGATILSVASSTEAELSAAATATGAGVAAAITPTGGEQDFSCQITNAVVAWSDETGDPISVLCGDEEEGDVTWSATLSGSVVQDPGTEAVDGMVQWTWENKGRKFPALFIPSNTAMKQVVGSLVVKPLDFGGEVKTTATSDFEWAYVGEPVLSRIPE